MIKILYQFNRATILLLSVGFAIIFLIFSLQSCKQKKSDQQTKSPTYEDIDTTTNQSNQFDFEGEPSLTRNFYFIFDGSGSMSGRIHGERKIDGAKKAAQRFIKQLPNDVNLGLYIFDSYGDREVIPLGPENHEKFLNAIDKIHHGGGTPLADAIKTGSTNLKNQREKQLGYGDYNLIVVTDGAANFIPEASEFAVKNGISIYAIGLGIGNDHPLNDPKYVISYTAAADFNQLTEALVEAAAESPVFDVTDFDE